MHCMYSTIHLSISPDCDVLPEPRRAAWTVTMLESKATKAQTSDYLIHMTNGLYTVSTLSKVLVHPSSVALMLM